MKVKIIKCCNPSWWYSEKIGDVFKVSNISGHEWEVTERIFIGVRLLKIDAEVVEEVEDCCNCAFGKLNRESYPCNRCEKWIDDCSESKWEKKSKFVGFKIKQDKRKKLHDTCNCLNNGTGELISEDCNIHGKAVMDAIENIKRCITCQFNVDRPTDKCWPYCVPNNRRNWQQQTEIVTNEHGAKQSKSEYCWIDIDSKSLLKVAKLSAAGREKYGADNWRKISVLDHVGHAISHLFLYLAKDTSEDHLSHAAWRVLAAMGVESNG